MKKILLGLTTVSQGKWEDKVKEIDELRLKEVALFPTGLNISERKELYQLLEKTKLENIPHVHLRNDMEIFELDYLTSRFRTEVFNIHSENSYYKFSKDYLAYFKKIFVENTNGFLPTKNDLKKYAGVCLDLSHWEAVIIGNGETCPESLALRKIANKYKVGCNHISAVKPEKISFYDRFSNEKVYCYDDHWLGDFNELDYVKKYKNYLADIISIELENPLKRQMEVKKYLEKILNN